MTDTHIEQHLNIEKDMPGAVSCLSDATGLSKQLIKQAMHKGCVWLTRNQYTQRLRRAKRSLQAGDELHIYYDEKILSLEPNPAVLIANEGAYSLWYKPYGMYSQGSKWGDHCAINRWVEQQSGQPAFVVHRLDRAASGLMLIAQEKKAAAALADLFQSRAIDKRYQIIVHGHFPKSNIAKKFDTLIDDKPATSYASAVSYQESDDQSWVEVRIETGRKHQIRRHLSEAGFPIVGDRLYGREGDEKDLQLCCSYLAFTCPLTGEKKSFELAEELKLFNQKTNTP
jgi:tRNA pseudouridine32 synthase/23S rRNA pseudouridine746 synthase